MNFNKEKAITLRSSPLQDNKTSSTTFSYAASSLKTKQWLEDYYQHSHLVTTHLAQLLNHLTQLDPPLNINKLLQHAFNQYCQIFNKELVVTINSKRARTIKDLLDFIKNKLLSKTKISTPTVEQLRIYFEQGWLTLTEVGFFVDYNPSYFALCEASTKEQDLALNPNQFLRELIYNSRQFADDPLLKRLITFYESSSYEDSLIFFRQHIFITIDTILNKAAYLNLGQSLFNSPIAHLSDIEDHGSTPWRNSIFSVLNRHSDKHLQKQLVNYLRLIIQLTEISMQISYFCFINRELLWTCEAEDNFFPAIQAKIPETISLETLKIIAKFKIVWQELETVKDCLNSLVKEEPKAKDWRTYQLKIDSRKFHEPLFSGLSQLNYICRVLQEKIFEKPSTAPTRDSKTEHFTSDHSDPCLPQNSYNLEASQKFIQQVKDQLRHFSKGAIVNNSQAFLPASFSSFFSSQASSRIEEKKSSPRTTPSPDIGAPFSLLTTETSKEEISSTNKIIGLLQDLGHEETPDKLMDTLSTINTIFNSLITAMSKTKVLLSIINYAQALTLVEMTSARGIRSERSKFLNKLKLLVITMKNCQVQIWFFSQKRFTAFHSELNYLKNLINLFLKTSLEIDFKKLKSIWEQLLLTYSQALTMVKDPLLSQYRNKIATLCQEYLAIDKPKFSHMEKVQLQKKLEELQKRALKEKISVSDIAEISSIFFRSEKFVYRFILHLCLMQNFNFELKKERAFFIAGEIETLMHAVELQEQEKNSKERMTAKELNKLYLRLYKIFFLHLPSGMAVDERHCKYLFTTTLDLLKDFFNIDAELDPVVKTSMIITYKFRVTPTETREISTDLAAKLLASLERLYEVDAILSKKYAYLADKYHDFMLAIGQQPQPDLVDRPVDHQLGSLRAQR